MGGTMSALRDILISPLSHGFCNTALAAAINFDHFHTVIALRATGLQLCLTTCLLYIPLAECISVYYAIEEASCSREIFSFQWTRTTVHSARHETVRHDMYIYVYVGFNSIGTRSRRPEVGQRLSYQDVTFLRERWRKTEEPAASSVRNNQGSCDKYNSIHCCK